MCGGGFGTRGLDRFDEQPVNAAVGGKFGVEGGGHQVALADQCGRAVAEGQGLDAGAGFAMRGARMKTISSGPPGRAVSAVRMAESICRP